jgi:hypothetical protein
VQEIIYGKGITQAIVKTLVRCCGRRKVHKQTTLLFQNSLRYLRQSLGIFTLGGPLGSGAVRPTAGRTGDENGLAGMGYQDAEESEQTVIGVILCLGM